MARNWTVGQMVERLRATAPPFESEVDRLVAGNPETPVAGIATAFSATWEVLEKAVAAGANLLLVHEGVYYSHREQTAWLPEDPVFAAKRERIERSGLAVYRCHDLPHRQRPDWITEALVAALGWEDRVEERLPEAAIVTLAPTSAVEVAELVKLRLGVPYVRGVGALTAPCTRVGVMVGYRGGGATAIPLLGGRRLDLVLAGEGPEWETPEYVADSVSQGREKALLLLGHAASEKPGMAALARRLQELFPGLPVHAISDSVAIRTL